MGKTALMKWNCSAEVFSYSHAISAEVFEEWNEKLGKNLDSPIMYHSINELERRFYLHFYLPESVGIEDTEIRAYMMGTSLVMALNIASPGAHIWWPPSVILPKFNIEHTNPKIMLGKAFKLFTDRKIDQNQLLDKKVLRRAEMLWPALIEIMNTQDRMFFNYMKGMNLWTIGHSEINYFEETFMCFWKALERFITTEYTKSGKRLKKDELLKVMGEVLPSTFYGEEIRGEIGQLYNLRGSTIAHSVGKEKRITNEEVGKIKLFADLFMFKVLMKRSTENFAKLEKEVGIVSD